MSLIRRWPQVLLAALIVSGSCAEPMNPAATLEQAGRSSLALDEDTPWFSVSTESLGFSTQPVGTESEVQWLLITNVRSTPMLLSASAATSAEFRVYTAPDPLGEYGPCAMMFLFPGATCFIRVAFSPSGSGPRRATLNIPAGTGGSRTVALCGIGIGAAARKPPVDQVPGACR